MAKGSNQKLKFAYLMKIMLEKTDDEYGLTMPQIIEELESYGIGAERKSIYGDFADMERFGIEVMCDKTGRDYIYHVTGRQFELAELKLLIDAIQSSKFITEKKSRQLINKIKSLASENEAMALQRQVFVQGRIKTMNESIYYNVDDIYNAINNNRKIGFMYYNWDTNKEFVPRHGGAVITVSPWALTWSDEYYYLIAYDDLNRELRHYRVDKMMHITVTEEARDGRDEFKKVDLARYAEANFGMFKGEIKKVAIEFPDSMVGVFIDRFGKDIPVRKAGSGRCSTRVDVAVSGQFFGWIMGLGPDVKITGPDDVVSDMAKALKDLTAVYKAKK